MDYEEFVTYLILELQKFYGKDAVITTENMIKNNGQYYHGLRILLKPKEKVVPIINLDGIFEKLKQGVIGMDECIAEISRIREECETTEDVREFAERVIDWEYAKENVYPILLSTEENRELIDRLVSDSLLDLSIVYIIRGNGGASVKVNKSMLKVYGIDRRELHTYAMRNMKKDGYTFQDMTCLIDEMLNGSNLEEDVSSLEAMEGGRMYVLTNTSKLYGAVGILDKELIRKITKGRNYYILPSSVHETIFVLADETVNSTELDKMVSEINEAMVAKEDRLSYHSYYYDAKEDEIRMCA